MPRLLIIGCDSRLGQAVAARPLTGWSVAGTSRRRGAEHTLDLEAAEAFALPPCDVVLIAAAEARLDVCRQDPERTAAINVAAPAALARGAVAAGAFSILMSTNLVFDGARPDAPADLPPNPSCAYGRQKAAAEAAVLAAGGAVLRLSKVLVPDLPLLVRWRDALCAGEAIDAFGDYMASPLTAELVADCVWAMAEARRPGIVQLSADRDLRYVDVARLMADHLGKPAVQVRETLAANQARPPEVLPRHTTLDAAALRALGLERPDAIDVVRRVVTGMSCRPSDERNAP